MRILTSILLPAVLLPGPALGQAPQDQPADIAGAAVAAVLASYDVPLQGRMVVDLDALGIAGIEELSVGDDRLQRGRLDDIYRCPAASELGRGCSLMGTDFLIVLQRVDVPAGQVELEVRGNYDSERQPVWAEHYAVSLERRGSEWIALEVRLLWQT